MKTKKSEKVVVEKKSSLEVGQIWQRSSHPDRLYVVVKVVMESVRVHQRSGEKIVENHDDGRAVIASDGLGTGNYTEMTRMFSAQELKDNGYELLRRMSDVELQDFKCQGVEKNTEQKERIAKIAKEAKPSKRASFHGLSICEIIRGLAFLKWDKDVIYGALTKLGMTLSPSTCYIQSRKPDNTIKFSHEALAELAAAAPAQEKNEGAKAAKKADKKQKE